MNFKNDSLSRSRRRRLVALVSVCAVLAGMIIYGVMSPSPEEKEYQRLREAFLSREPGESGPGGGNIDNAAREELRKSFEQLSPETRDKLVQEIMRDRLRDVREKLKSIGDEEKQAKIDEMVTKMRERFSGLDDDQREEIKERLTSKEGKERLQKSLAFYYAEFTADERKLLDPLVNEILTELNSL